ncbi:hypothetical protein [Streptomyces sp. NRRL F-2580]|uniref:hypothetical protein n=1 Tax=Streptomyces sp. NRRL F-2580 TaxID=1463841 RepID=UPI0004C4BCCD|nr:hypothetical protein [Streptomyces sp. NRRL F-2580]
MTRGPADSEPVEPEDPQGPEGEQHEEAPGEEDRSKRGKAIGSEALRFALNGFADDVADGLVWAAQQAWEFGASFL